MNEWMNEWLNKWMNEWMNEWLNEWMTEWLTEWMNEWNEMKWKCFDLKTAMTMEWTEWPSCLFRLTVSAIHFATLVTPHAIPHGVGWYGITRSLERFRWAMRWINSKNKIPEYYIWYGLVPPLVIARARTKTAAWLMCDALSEAIRFSQHE